MTNRDLREEWLKKAKGGNEKLSPGNNYPNNVFKKKLFHLKEFYR